MRARCSATLAFTFLRLWVSLAETKKAATDSRPAARKRS
jgi:hypothetical protein